MTRLEIIERKIISQFPKISPKELQERMELAEHLIEFDRTKRERKMKFIKPLT